MRKSKVILSACTSELSTTEGSDSVPVATQTTGPTHQDLTTAAPTAPATQDTSGTTALDTSYENAVSVEMQLLLGTLSLTGDLAITEGQASVLLPLWTDLKTLSMSMGPGQAQVNATSQPQAQIDALVSQIEAAMTPEQIEAIAAMKITQDSAMTIMQAQGLTMGGGSGNPPPSGGQPPSGGPQPPSGTPPTDGPQPPGGDQPPGGGPMTAPPAGGGVIPPELFDALIQALGGTPSTAVATPSAPAGSGSATGTSGSISAAYTQTGGTETKTGGTETKTGGTYTASDTNQSAILVTAGGSLTLTGAAITTSGDTASQENSSFYGLNAAVLANDASQIILSDSSITTSGTGASGSTTDRCRIVP